MCNEDGKRIYRSHKSIIRMHGEVDVIGERIKVNLHLM